MTAPSSVLELVERFDRDKTTYKSPLYNETQTRQEFIDPLFGALGWDIGNRGGAAAAFREVVLEYSMKIGDKSKAPDYLFQLGGTPKFFVEAKKPSVNLKDDTSPAFQVRRYAWSATLPLSVLTDFEEFVVYDCRIEPNKTDKSAVARMFYIPYTDYAAKWDTIAALFSREAVLGGALERFAQEQKAPKGATTVDTAFLREIETWRERLAKNIAIWNPELSQRELNYAVQMTLDRIIFLRIAEDRGIEPYGQLQGLLNSGAVYKQLVEQFRRADDRYNSGLFHFAQEKGREDPDSLTPALYIDDEPLKHIIRNLYYPDSPYEFSVIPVELLGRVYEQFLGKVIHLNAKHEAVVEEKPEVRKAGGVYYTPAYIVDYIVKQTVGKLLEDKTPKEAAKLRILDPACGSGSFLLGAYQHLLDWHLAQYIAAGPAKFKKELFQGPSGAWRLTSAERKRILLNNIYGVDIDAQAVEVTKLSLSLKVLEGESSATLGTQMRMFQERALPDLSNNIKCGNSLIGPDFYDQQEMTLLDADEQYRINVFDWEEGFPDIIRAGGFDAVIGNPPYIRIQAMKEWAPVEVEEYKRLYFAARQGNYDIYVVFVERGLSLLKENGRLSFILPHKFFNAQYGEPLRKLLAEGMHLTEIVHFGHQQIFVGATTYTCLLFLNKDSQNEFEFTKVDDLAAWRLIGSETTRSFPASRLTSAEWNIGLNAVAKLYERIGQTPTNLGSVARIFQGLVTGADKVYVLEQVSSDTNGLMRVIDRLGNEWDLEQEPLKPFINDVSLATFGKPVPKHRIIFPYDLSGDKPILIPSDIFSEKYPKVWSYLNHQSPALRQRENGKWNHNHWYAFARTQNLTQMDGPKLVVQVISLSGRYAYDNTGIYFTGGGNGPYYGVRWFEQYQRHSLHYLQALLNSKLLDGFLHSISSPFRGGYWSYGKRFIELIPIRTINFDDPTDKKRHDDMVALVERMLELHKRLAAAKTGQEKTVLQRQIDATDKQIDRLVYELYELTDAEITIVEGATA